MLSKRSTCTDTARTRQDVVLARLALLPGEPRGAALLGVHDEGRGVPSDFLLATLDEAKTEGGERNHIRWWGCTRHV
jgi:hypothetical protein